MAEHSHGPWKAVKYDQGWAVNTPIGQFGMDHQVCALIPNESASSLLPVHRHEANARRIVACVNACEGINPEAVPDLLAACEYVKYAAPETEGLEPGNILSVSLTVAGVRQLRAAISKATGEEPE